MSEGTQHPRGLSDRESLMLAKLLLDEIVEMRVQRKTKESATDWLMIAIWQIALVCAMFGLGRLSAAL